MITFNKLSQENPYTLFYNLYNESLEHNQKNIEAICIASYSTKNSEVSARFVNLKYVNDKEFIFFTNYNSQKALDFNSHSQISGLMHWNAINVQIRIKAHIKKTSMEFNNSHFAQRDLKKNALAISSNQSSIIESYKKVQENYKKAISNENLKECPVYWGGYSFRPYYFEFWKGHDSRLNERKAYKLENNKWLFNYLQP